VLSQINLSTEGLFVAVLLLGGVSILLLFLYIKQQRRLAKLERRYQTLTRGSDGVDWQRMLEKLSEDMETVMMCQQAEGVSIADIKQQFESALYKKAMIHYDAFPNISGELSFSVAVLNGYNNGFVLSNIHGREDARCYLREVISGRIEMPCTAEEILVVEKAKHKKWEGYR